MTGLDQRFKVRAPLRCNGIGRLECAEDAESGMRLAVRWLPLEANGQAAVLACQSLPSHPTLPRIRKTGQVGASAFVAMDFPEGRLLSTWEDAVSPEVLARVAAQIADALATIHAQAVFHGEISADSVLLVGEGDEKAYLWDMPLVIANRLTDRRGEDRLMQQLVRAAPFLAPERARGAGASAPADVYALGAVLCLAGGARRPASPTTLGAVYEVASGGWSPVVPDLFPDSLRALVARMVSAEAALRPTAREVADAFAQPVQSMPTVREMPAIVVPAPVAASAPMVRVATPIPQPVLPAPAVTAPDAAPSPVGPAGAIALSSIELPMPSAPAPWARPAADVALAENIAVSPELADAGAQSFSAEEAAALFRPRWTKAMTAVTLVLVGVVAGLTWVAVSLARTELPVQVVERAAAPAPAVAVPAVAPVPQAVAALAAPVAIDEDLASLPVLPAKAPRAAPARKAKPAPAAKAVPEVASDPRPEQFDFLDSSPAEQPAEELKRPSF